MVVLNCDPFCKCFIAEVRGHKRRFTPVFCYKLCAWVLFFLPFCCMLSFFSRGFVASADSNDGVGDELYKACTKQTL